MLTRTVSTKLIPAQRGFREIHGLRAAWRSVRYIRASRSRRTELGGFDLNGKRALVTGGSAGIGAALAAELVAAGATVVSLDIAPPEDHRPGVEHVTGDVRTFDFSTLDPFDLLVANAGVVDSSPTGELGEAALDRLIGINLTGAIRTLEAPKTDAARALLVSSGSAVSPTIEGLAYGATKAALLNIASAFGCSYPTTVGLVGITETKLFEAEAAFHGRPDPVLAPGMGNPSDVARRLVAGVAAGHSCVVTDRNTLRDVTAYSHWLLTAACDA